MKVEFEIEESRELAVFIVERLAKDAGLSNEDRAALRSWRSAMTPGSEAMRDLHARINADVARALQNQKRSALIKPDWR